MYGCQLRRGGEGIIWLMFLMLICAAFCFFLLWLFFTVERLSDDVYNANDRDDGSGKRNATKGESEMKKGGGESKYIRGGDAGPSRAKSSRVEPSCCRTRRLGYEGGRRWLRCMTKALRAVDTTGRRRLLNASADREGERADLGKKGRKKERNSGHE
ncbi:hypothetical protein B0T19DRAFT_299799 [Cercophora scortea]|uniref:Uncharacterized protein n=1 Tax=Cercophora scortea TaxID=314031 RepID=A0AAE0I466_9PEZI|nr:hypothetical protein B0T19DRAFT_299799 [Cercophora scortea]